MICQIGGDKHLAHRNLDLGKLAHAGYVVATGQWLSLASGFSLVVLAKTPSRGRGNRDGFGLASMTGVTSENLPSIDVSFLDLEARVFQSLRKSQLKLIRENMTRTPARPLTSTRSAIESSATRLVCAYPTSVILETGSNS